jgi:hypothetical protein
MLAQATKKKLLTVASALWTRFIAGAITRQMVSRATKRFVIQQLLTKYEPVAAYMADDKGW